MVPAGPAGQAWEKQCPLLSAAGLGKRGPLTQGGASLTLGNPFGVRALAELNEQTSVETCWKQIPAGLTPKFVKHPLGGWAAGGPAARMLPTDIVRVVMGGTPCLSMLPQREGTLFFSNRGR